MQDLYIYLALILLFVLCSFYYFKVKKKGSFLSKDQDEKILDKDLKIEELNKELANLQAKCAAADERAALKADELLKLELKNKNIQESLNQLLAQNARLDTLVKEKELNHAKNLEEKAQNYQNELEAKLKNKDELIALNKERFELDINALKISKIEALAIKDELLTQAKEELENKKEELKELAKYKEENINSFKKEMSLIFAKLSSEGLKTQSEHFSLSQAASLKELQDNLKALQKNMQEDSEKRYKTHGELNTQIKTLFEQSNQISQATKDLTKALKGNTKLQGDWGESVLATLLEQSGMQEGFEYELQLCIDDELGNKLRPDAIINLPNKRSMIVDAKVSLTAYTRFCSSEDKDERTKNMKEHIKSLKTHINELSKKYDRQNIISRHGIKSLSADFSVMFVPIDAALNDAILNDTTLTSYAYAKNVILVNQISLFCVLKMIDLLMQNEAKDENRDKIYDALIKLLGKFDGFVRDVESIGKSINSLQKNYDASYKKLISDKGSLKSRKEKLEKLLTKVNQREDLLINIKENDDSLKLIG